MLENKLNLKIIISTGVVIMLLISCFYGFVLNDDMKSKKSLNLSKEPKEMNKETIIKNFESAKNFFTKNCGQIENDAIYFTYTSQNLNFAFQESSILIKIYEKLDDNKTKSSIIKLTFENSNKVIPHGQEKLKHKSNYFISKKLKSDAPNYKKIIYENLYEGIDLVYYFNEKGLKYDWIIKPFGNPKNIIEKFEGIESLKLCLSGELIIKTRTGEIIEDKPYSYQKINENSKEVEMNFKKIDKNKITYKVSDYDISKDLIIDPLIYSTYIGGENRDGYLDSSIALDKDNNAYITGDTYSPDFPTVNYLDDSLNGTIDIFVFKLSSDGSTLLYSTFIGGSDDDWSESIVLDSENNAYITGATYSSDFPTTPNCLSSSLNGTKDIFVIKLSNDGTKLLYSTYIGGKDHDYGKNIALDKENNIYLTGYTCSSNFPTTFGCLDDSYNGGDGWIGGDAFVLKLNSNGTSLLYSTFIGGDNNDYGMGIAIDKENNVYITGYTKSPNFPTTNSSFDNLYNEDYDVFVFKLNQNGSSLIYSTFIGGDDRDKSYDICIDKENNVYITGYTQSSDFPTTSNCFDDALNGQKDIFVFKLNWNGTSILYSTYIGGNDSDYGFDIELDLKNNAYITGYTKSQDFPTTLGCFDNTLNGSGDIIALTLNQNASSLLYSTFVGGSYKDYGFTIALDNKNNVYITGVTSSLNFPTTPLCYNNLSNGYYDVFVFKLSFTPKLTPIIDSIYPNPAVEGENICFIGKTVNGNIERYVWTSDIDGEFYNGTESTFLYSNLSNGTHIISLKVKNNKRWSEEVFTVLNINGIPRAKIEIIEPKFANEGETINFLGNGIDDGKIVEYYWTSSIDGFLSKEKSFSISNLSNGTHIISLKIKDNYDVCSNEVQTTLKINGIPRAKIDIISQVFANENQEIYFHGKGLDDGNIISYNWFSDIDGFLSSKNFFTVSNLSNGTHIISLKVKDNNNVWSSEVNTTLFINGIPVPKIDKISPNFANEGDNVCFYGKGTDDGTIKDYKWTSSIDGFLSNKKSFSTSNLSNGTHKIYFKVKDNNEIWSNEVQTTITINGIPRAKINKIKPNPANELEKIWFYGNAIDDGNIIKYYWESSIDGFLSSKKYFSTSELSIGEHKIYFKAQDNYGVWSKETSINLTISIYQIPLIKFKSSNATIDKTKKAFIIRGSASVENGKIIKIQIKIDGGEWEDAVGTNNWSYTWNITNASEGEHLISVRAFDGYSYSKIEKLKINIVEGKEESKEVFPVIYLFSFVGIIIILIGFLSQKKKREKKQFENIEKISEEESLEAPEKQLEKSQSEKDILLRELHHRVKNNLQVVSSLLYLQSEEFKDKTIHEKFKETEERIKSMALIHETLYRSKDLNSVDFNSYIKKLASNLFATYGADTSIIKLEINVEKIKLDLDHSIPLGLIINELVSNSLKYAFIGKREGKIKISLYSLDKNTIELIVSDDGIGMPKDFDLAKSKSLGLHLVKMLVEDQLNGQIRLNKSKGTTFYIKFGVTNG